MSSGASNSPYIRLILSRWCYFSSAMPLVVGSIIHQSGFVSFGLVNGRIWNVISKLDVWVLDYEVLLLKANKLAGRLRKGSIVVLDIE